MATQADTERRPESPGTRPDSEPENELKRQKDPADDSSDDGDRNNNEDTDRNGKDKGTGDDKDDSSTDTPSTDDEFGDKGSTGKYWEVDLVRPPGGSEALLSYLDLAEAAIQMAVDLLGRGMPEPPPNVTELLSKITRETLGKGKAEEAYQATLDKVETRQTSLVDMDKQVTDTSIVMAAEQDRTLKMIIEIVDRLNEVLTKVGTAKLKPPIETQLLDLIATAVDLVYDKVIAASELSSEMAGGGSDSTGSDGGGAQSAGTGGGSGGGAGGGMEGLFSMLPMLAMIPMSLAPMAAEMLPELLDPEKNKDEEGEESATGEGAPEPIDPTAPSDGATAPDDQPAPEGQNENQEKPQENSPQVQV